MRWFPLLLVLSACGKEEVLPETGMLGQGPVMPYPNGLLIDADGFVDLPVDALPLPIDGTPLPVETLRWRRGFSSGQTSMVVLDDVDQAELPHWRNPTPGEGGVRMVDLDTGVWLPVFAELDAWCDINAETDVECNDTTPALLVRPLQALTRDHRVAVVVTTDAAPRPEFYDMVIDGGAKGPVVDHQRALHDELAQAGVPSDSIAVAWDFPIHDGGMPLRSALAEVDVPTSWSFDVVRDRDDGDALPPGIWRSFEGTITVTDFLVDDLLLDQQADGSALPTGEVEAYILVTIPESLRDSTAGTAPVLVFGHGLFGHPRGYLNDESDTDQVAAITNDLGAITVSTTWRGLTQDDRLEALQTAADFGKFPLVPNRVVQGHAAVRAILLAASQGGLFDDSQLAGASGQTLSDGQDVIYYGISLGGIEGQVLMAQDFPVSAAGLHVPGGMWSTMLERSTQWTPFELVIGGTLPRPNDRQMAYNVAQLWWDPVDPINYVPELAGKSLLYQESIGDEQVANMTTRVLARSVGVPVLEPVADPPWSIQTATGPIGPGQAALVQYDPMVGVPDDVNRPAGNTKAHSIPRTWPGARQQVVDFLAVDARGTVVHHCGTGPCSAENPGELTSE